MMNVASTHYGLVSGVSLGDVTVFRGVPYAQSPVGDLRWRDPVDPLPWEGVRVCDTYAKVCPQHFCDVEPYISDFYYQPQPEMSEDCLYLDITTAASQPGEKRPVYLWFHGGGLSFGYSSEPEFDGQELAKKGIVVVSAASRLNAFGFLALSQLKDENGNMGNYGLKDLMKALDWVRENIAAFGGDPDNITVGGQSGGSQKAGTLAAMKYTQGKIRRVIMQSGLKWLQRYPSPEEAEAASRRFLEEVGVDPDLPAEELRKLPWQTFWKKGAHAPGAILWDGDVIENQIAKDNFLRYLPGLDILNGTNMGESTPIAEPASAAEFYAAFREELGEKYTACNFEDLVKVTDDTALRTARVLATYGLSQPGRVNFSRNLMVDRLFGKVMAEKAPEGKVYSYLFTHEPPSLESDKGTDRDPEKQMSYHSVEMFYTFASLKHMSPPYRIWRQEDYALAEQVSSYWANFISTGDPNGENLPHWPKSDGELGYIELKTDPQSHTGLGCNLDKLIYEYVLDKYGFSD